MMSDIFRYLNAHTYSPEPSDTIDDSVSESQRVLSKVRLKRFIKKMLRSRYTLSERVHDAVSVVNFTLNSNGDFVDKAIEEAIGGISTNPRDRF